MTVPQLPASVKIGPAVYLIVEFDPLEARASERFGEVNRLSRVIRLDTSQGLLTTLEGLVHETLHEVIRTWGILWDERDSEERVTTTLTPALLAVMIDNPQVMTWVVSALEEIKKEAAFRALGKGEDSIQAEMEAASSAERLARDIYGDPPDDGGRRS